MMHAISAARVSPAAITAQALAQNPGGIAGLPTPILEPLNPSDQLGEMMAMLERMNHLSTRHTEHQLRHAGEKLQEQLDKFLKLIADAIRRAKQAKKKKKKGFLKKITSSVSSAIGGAVGKALAAVTQNPDWGKKVEGFTKGALQFSADLAQFSAKLAIALATNGPDTTKAWDSLKEEAKEAWHSFQENCLENPDFMEVVGYIAKGSAVAAAVMSGGALAVVAVGVFAFCEFDARTKVLDKTFGKEYGPWVRVGLNVTSAVLLGAAGGSDYGAVARYMGGGAAVIQGASNVNAGVKALEEAKRVRTEMRSQAELQQTLNRMHEAQRLIDELLADMEEHAEDKNRGRELSGAVVEIRAATNEALILRA